MNTADFASITCPRILQSTPRLGSANRSIGLDLVAARELPEDDEIIRHLRLGEHFPGARLELGCWAGLRRNGYRPRRPGTTGKQPDFLVGVEGMVVAVECKTLSNGSEVDNTLALQLVFEDSVALAVMQGPPRSARCHLSAEAQVLTRTLPGTFRATVLPEFETALRHALAGCAGEGASAEVGRFGSIKIVADGERWLHFDYADNPELRARRIVSTLEDAASKFVDRTPEQYRLAVMQAADNYLNARVASDVLSRLPGLRCTTFFDAGLLLSFNNQRMEPGWVALEYFLRSPSSDRAPPPARLLRSLSAWQRHARAPAHV